MRDCSRCRCKRASLCCGSHLQQSCAGQHTEGSYSIKLPPLYQIHAEVRGNTYGYMRGPQLKAHQDGMVEGFKGALRSSGCLWRLFWTSFGVFLQKVSVIPYTTYSYS